jgi:hypothetical protein
MRLLSSLAPDIIVDAVIVSSLLVGTALVMPRVIYSMLAKDGLFSDD